MMDLNSYYDKEKELLLDTVYYIDNVDSAKRFMNAFKMQYHHDLKWINGDNLDEEDMISKKISYAKMINMDAKYLGFVLTPDNKCLALHDNEYYNDEYIIY